MTTPTTSHLTSSDSGAVDPLSLDSARSFKSLASLNFLRKLQGLPLFAPSVIVAKASQLMVAQGGRRALFELDPFGEGPLHDAVRYDEPELADFLIQWGFDIERGLSEDPQHFPLSPFCVAAMHGCVKSLKKLIALGCNPLSLSRYRENALNLAAQHDQRDAFAFLLSLGISPFAMDQWNNNAALYALYQHLNFTLIIRDVSYTPEKKTAPLYATFDEQSLALTISTQSLFDTPPPTGHGPTLLPRHSASAASASPASPSKTHPNSPHWTPVDSSPLHSPSGTLSPDPLSDASPENLLSHTLELDITDSSPKALTPSSQQLFSQVHSDPSTCVPPPQAPFALEHDTQASLGQHPSTTPNPPVCTTVIPSPPCGSLSCFDQLLKAGFYTQHEFEIPKQEGGTQHLLRLVSQHGDIARAAMDHLLALGSHPDACNASGDTPLLLAIRSPKPSGALCVRLLEAGASAHHTNAQGESALSLIKASHGHSQTHAVVRSWIESESLRLHLEESSTPTLTKPSYKVATGNITPNAASRPALTPLYGLSALVHSGQLHLEALASLEHLKIRNAHQSERLKQAHKEAVGSVLSPLGSVGLLSTLSATGFEPSPAPYGSASMQSSEEEDEGKDGRDDHHGDTQGEDTSRSTSTKLSRPTFRGAL